MYSQKILHSNNARGATETWREMCLRLNKLAELQFVQSTSTLNALVSNVINMTDKFAKILHGEASDSNTDKTSDFVNASNTLT